MTEGRGAKEEGLGAPGAAGKAPRGGGLEESVPVDWGKVDLRRQRRMGWGRVRAGSAGLC